MTYTLAMLEELVWDRLENNTVLYTQPEVDAIINEALSIANMFIGFYQTTQTVSGGSVAGQQIYSMPASIIFPVRVQFNGRQLEKTVRGQLAKQNYSWCTDTTTTRGPVAHWIPFGTTAFALHPIDARGGGVIQVIGISQVPTLSAPNDVIALEDEQVGIISDYCAHRLPLKLPGKIFADASELYKQFLRDIKRKTMWTRFAAPRYYIGGVGQ
jgi:hypothetical protein